MPPQVMSNNMRTKKNTVVLKWQEKFRRDIEHLHHSTRQQLEAAMSRKRPMTIWLGGPGRAHRLYNKRILIKQLLEAEGFNVIISEEYEGKLNLASKEILEYASVEMVIILSITPGASGEALDFAHVKDRHEKLYIYYPEEYQKGYVYQSLYWHHRIVNQERVFSLKKFRRDTSDLPIRVLFDAMNFLVWRKIAPKLRRM
jgi:hypothetical protein